MFQFAFYLEGEERDFEEEFYYTEVDSDLDPNASEVIKNKTKLDLIRF